MRSVRSLALIGSIVALGALAPLASASSDKPFHIEKDCAPPTCEITSSSYRGIPAGSVISYSPNGDGTLTALITVAHGTATGTCDLRPIPSSPGSCVFASGTGTLTQFRLNVDVEVVTEDFVTWTWDGTYSFGSSSGS